MTTFFVFRAAKNGSAVVFEKALLTGTTYNLTLTTTQSSVTTMTLIKARVVLLTLTTIQQSSAGLTKLLSITRSATQAVTTTLITATTLNSFGMAVQNSVTTLTKQLNFVRSATQSTVTTLARVFKSGAAGSTFFITLSATQNSVGSVTKGIQTIKNTAQSSVTSLIRLFTSGGVKVIFMTLTTVQKSVTSVVVSKILGGLNSGLGAALLLFTGSAKTPINTAFLSGTGPGSFLTTYLKDTFFGHWFRTATWAKPTQAWWALFTVAPAPDGTGGVEVTGAGYLRVQVNPADSNYSAPTTPSGTLRVLTNAVTIQFPQVLGDWGQIVGAGRFDSAVNGNLEGFTLITTPTYVKAGDSPPSFPPGSLTITIQ